MDKKIEKITFLELNKIAMNGKGVTSEGLVMLGCGGSLSEWINGVSEELYSAGVTTSSNPKLLWANIYKTNTKDQRVDLIFMFNEDFNELFNVSKLAIWRIKWGDASWLSDYLQNFANHHENIEVTGGI